MKGLHIATGAQPIGGRRLKERCVVGGQSILPFPTMEGEGAPPPRAWQVEEEVFAADSSRSAWPRPKPMALPSSGENRP